MTVTLNELLMLAGPLDEGTGFDSPRERFRRFLLEHVTNATVARSLIEQCQHAPGDQHYLALQDLVVAVGRCLGFDSRFGSHLPAAGSWKPDGYWHSRRLDVILDIRTQPSGTADCETLSRSVAALTRPSRADTTRRALGLCVLAPLFAGRGRLAELQSSDDPASNVRIASLRTLLSIADMMATRSLTHDDLVRLLAAGLDLDFVAGLLERAAGAAGPRDVPAAHSDSSGMQEGRGFWLAAVGADQGTTAEQYVEIVIGKRRIFGIDRGASDGAVGPGDGICLHVAGKGVIGHCQVRTITEGGGGLRAAHRIGQLLHLDDVVLYPDAPVPLDEQLQLRILAARAGGDRPPHTLTRITRQQFEGLTSIRDTGEAPLVGGTPETSDSDKGQVELPVSVGDSRSHE